MLDAAGSARCNAATLHARVMGAPSRVHRSGPARAAGETAARPHSADHFS
ncbi:hypothetical protein BUC_2251 [Burkholderia pseudomallei 576]|nr:hypothetical protein BUC_2251 [Burkholderia pseudomallei 576]